VDTESEEAGVVDGLLALPAEHHHLHRVVQAHGGHATEVLEGAHVLADAGGEVLGVDEAQVAPAGIAEDVAEGIDPPASLCCEVDVEGRVVHLRLDAGACLEAHHWLGDGLGAQAAQPLAHDGVGTFESALR
jgi:hypothetical protein